MKINRNDPCPCGSGKKYKKCCLKTTNEISGKKVYDDYMNWNTQFEEELKDRTDAEIAYDNKILEELQKGNTIEIAMDLAEKKYPDLKGKIKPTSKSRSGRTGETEDWCDLYTIEFRVPDIVTINDLEDGGLKEKLLQGYEANTKIEIENYYQVVMINRTEQAETPSLTGFNRFRMIPVIHTPRLEDSTYPFGVSKLMKGKQDQINITGTVALDAVKADIKNLLVLINADPKLQEQYRREAAKTNGIIVVDKAEAKAIQMQRQGISPAVLEWYQWQRRAFDEVIGRYAPEKGAVEEGLSGKAIGLLQARGTVPELTKKLHLEYAFTQMALVILECIGFKMNQQKFAVSRNVDGNERMIYYNTPVKEIGQVTQDDKLNVVNNNIINDLTKIDIDEIDLSIGVEMDVVGRETQEMNKALISHKNGLMGRQDTTRKLYPKEWREIAENMEKENAAMALLAKIMKLAPDQIGELAKQAQNVDEFIEYVNNLEGGNGSVKVSPKQTSSVPGQ